MITQEQVDKLKAAMIEACDKHLAEGGVIATGVFVGFMVGDTSSKCPIGCLSGGTNYFANANAILGLPEYDGYLWEFVSAFDGWKCQYPSLLHLLGQELRAKYITKG